MKITEENYEKFYFGNSNECFIQGEFYAHGYEAAKPSPDIGYDLIVTNCARTRFLKEEPKQFNVQVKSTVCNDKGLCLICIDDIDLNMIKNDANGYLVCVFCKPEFSPVRGLIHVNRDSVADTLQEYFDEYSINEWNESDYVSFYKLKEYESALNLVGFSRSYVWFSKKHIERLIKLKAIWLDSINGNKVWKIYFRKDEESLIMLDKEQDEVSDSRGLSMTEIAYELRKINYLGNDDIEDSLFYGDSYY